ncbi:MAG: penicillin-binding transpeptidase domain-containing protein [Gemmatimonadaceae bacterium]
MSQFEHQRTDHHADPGSKPLVSRGRTSLVHGSLVLFAIALIARAVQVQLIDGKFWAEKAINQQIRESSLPAPRGQILDERGVVMAESRELVQVAIAPNEIRRERSAKQDDRRDLQRTLTTLGMSKLLIRSALDSNKKWLELPRPFVPRDVEPLLKLRSGIHPTYVMQRVIAAPEGVRRLIGVVDSKGNAVGGIEQEMDSLLRGRTGRRTSLRDGRGKYFDTPSLTGVEATPGHSVTLTINSILQDICERELSLALKRTGATGGDVVIVDPRDGSILALAGYRNGKVPVSSTPLAEGYEPGSVLKPFIVANLLDRGLVRPDDMVNTEVGPYIVRGKPWPTDEHKRPSMPVHDVIRNSSNIGIVKLATKLTAQQEFELLRDFGFGVQPGTPYPAESRGRLVLPKQWSAQTGASMAMGYEMIVTPLQLAVAYAAIANGGELLQPALIREIRDANGTVVFEHQRRALRRVLSAKSAEQMRVILESVVDSGTSLAADLQTFDVAGKSGTARRSEGGAYRDGKYNATFAGMFPAKKPQYVIVARLIDPKGLIFGGLVAAPVVNKILQGAVATRDVQLDRTALAAAARPIPFKVDSAALRLAATKDSIARISALKRLGGKTAVDFAASADGEAMIDTSALIVQAAPSVSVPLPTSVVVLLPYKPKSVKPAAAQMRIVPNVSGLNLRDAVRTLHAAGFQVRLEDGVAGHTKPAAGLVAPSGSSVTLGTSR